MAEPIEVVYQESLRAITQQQAVLDGLRSRASMLLAAAAVTTSFLAGLARTGTLDALGVAASMCFLVVGALCQAIWWPTGGWVFELSARRLVQDFVEAEDPVDERAMYRELALRLEDHHDTNAKKLGNRFWLFRLAAILLTVEVLLWISSLLGR